MTIKPDWKDAPEWANYLAMDSSGDWYWYENKPIKYLNVVWDAPSGSAKRAFRPADTWKDSLEPRPE